MTLCFKSVGIIFAQLNPVFTLPTFLAILYRGLNSKGFNLLLYSITLRPLSLSVIDIRTLILWDFTLYFVFLVEKSAI